MRGFPYQIPSVNAMEESQDMFAFVEGNAKLAPAITFSQYYTGMQEQFDSAAGIIPQERLEQYRARMEAIKDNSSLLYTEKNKQATELVEQWRTDCMEVTLLREVDHYIAHDALSAAQAKDFRARINAAAHNSALSAQGKEQAMRRIEEQVAQTALPNYFGETITKSVISQLEEMGYVTAYFNGAFQAYRARVAALGREGITDIETYNAAYNGLMEEIGRLMADENGYWEFVWKQAEIMDTY